jgi:hypothetical protein
MKTSKKLMLSSAIVATYPPFGHDIKRSAMQYSAGQLQSTPLQAARCHSTAHPFNQLLGR